MPSLGGRSGADAAERNVALFHVDSYHVDSYHISESASVGRGALALCVGRGALACAVEGSAPRKGGAGRVGALSFVCNLTRERDSFSL